MAHTKCFAFINIFISSFQSPPQAMPEWFQAKYKAGFLGRLTNQERQQEATVILKEDSYKWEKV